MEVRVRQRSSVWLRGGSGEACCGCGARARARCGFQVAHWAVHGWWYGAGWCVQLASDDLNITKDSRMFYVLGKETMLAMKSSSVLIIGLRGLGVEVGTSGSAIPEGLSESSALTDGHG